MRFADWSVIPIAETSVFSYEAVLPLLPFPPANTRLCVAMWCLPSAGCTKFTNIYLHTAAACCIMVLPLSVIVSTSSLPGMATRLRLRWPPCPSRLPSPSFCFFSCAPLPLPPPDSHHLCAGSGRGYRHGPVDDKRGKAQHSVVVFLTYGIFLAMQERRAQTGQLSQVV